MTKKWKTSINVDIDVDAIWDVVDDDDFLAEFKRRKLDKGTAYTDQRSAWEDFADQLRDVMRSGDRTHLEVLLVQMMIMGGIPHIKTPGLFQEDSVKHRASYRKTAQ